MIVISHLSVNFLMHWFLLREERGKDGRDTERRINKHIVEKYRWKEDKIVEKKVDSDSMCTPNTFFASKGWSR